MKLFFLILNIIILLLIVKYKKKISKKFKLILYADKKSFHKNKDGDNCNGLIEYLNEQYEFWEESDPEEIGSFWIGTTEKCHYKSYEEFKNDLDSDMVLKILQNAWEASSRSETEFLEKQFINDFPFPKGTKYFCPYENMEVVSQG